MEVGGWVQVSLGIFLCVKKSAQNSPKPVLIFGSSIPCVCILSVYIAKSCWLLLFECSVHVSNGFPKNKIWMGVVGVVSSVQVFPPDFLEVFDPLLFYLLLLCRVSVEKC